MTLSDIEWPFYASRAISVVDELLAAVCFRLLASSETPRGPFQQRVL